MQKKLLLLFFFSTYILSSQNDRRFFYGVISDDLGPLLNVHIINTNTKKATNSNEEGKFRIYAKSKDSITFTYVGYKTKNITLSISDFGLEEKHIHLQKEIIELDEVVVKNHSLTGSLEIDQKQTPEDLAAKKANRIINDIKNMDSEAIKNMGYGIDELHLQKVSAPGIPNSFQGAGTSASLPDYDGIRKRKLRKEISFKEEFPKRILSRFGEHFFFTELKIPKEKFYHFLEYCNPLGIEQLFKDGKTMDLVAIFNEESKSYLKTIQERE